MPNPKTSLLTALLCGAALLASACNKPEENQAASPETSAPTQVAETEPSPAPQVNELQTPPPPPVVEVPPSDTSSLDARERELKAREAELDARERRLRQPAPAPAPKPRSKPAPAPAPRATEPEPAPAPEPVPAAPAEEPAPSPEPAPEPAPERITTVTLPAGTQLDVELTRTLASNTSRAGDAFRVRIDRDVIEDGVVAIPAGSEVLGEVTEAVPLKKIGGQARLGLRFTDLVLPSGKTVPIDASFVQSGRSETGRDAATIGGAAAGGAILGRILNKGNRSKGSVLGAIIGAAAGTAIASKTPGEEVVLPQGSVVTLKLDRSIEVRAQD
jgi:hypothetical protein